MATYSALEQILDLARWAPSGDNNQPWQFEILSDRELRVHARDQSDHDVYDFDGQPTLLTLGFLLESIRIAASGQGRSIQWTHRAAGDHQHEFDITFESASQLTADALLPFLSTRSVDRRPYRRVPLTATQKTALEAALGDALAIRWFDSFGERMQMAKINASATHIRLSIPEAYAAHRRILDWKQDKSPTGVPAKAIGIDPMTLTTMQWVMQKWSRAQFMNRFAAGTVVPRLEMDMAPGLFCSAHFAITTRDHRRADSRAIELLHTGQALQRFWLAATSLGLVMQPSLAPICFAHYGRQGTAFTQDEEMRRQAQRLARRLDSVAGVDDPGRLMFMGRIGMPVSTGDRPRSVRKPLAELMFKPD